MSNWTIRVLILSMVLGWTTRIAADNNSSDPAETPPAIEFANPPTVIDRAGVLQKLLWAVITVINLEDEYKLIPLYGYPLSTMSEDTQIEALTEAVAGNVNVAILCPSPGAGNAQGDEAELVFMGQGIRVSGNESDVADLERLRERWAAFKSDTIDTLCDEALVAFTRPLPDTSSSVSATFVPPAEVPEEFVAWSRFWQPSGMRPAGEP